MPPDPQTPRRAGPFPAAALALAAGGCAGELSTLDPAGPAAASIARLWWVMFAGSLVLFALVMGLFLLVLYRPGFGAGVSQKRWIVAGGLMLPIPVLALLTYYALFQGERLISFASAGEPVRIEARARMWEWEFRYPDRPDAAPTVGVMHIPAGRPVEVTATSDDVIHGFWVPRLAGKVDATPGHAARLKLMADRPGSYGGVCAEFCGTGHTGMFFTVRAHAAEDYDAAFAPPAAPDAQPQAPR